MGRIARVAGTAALAAACSASSAWAGCVVGQWSAQLNENQAVRTTLLIDRNFCNLTFTGGLNVSYDAITIVRRPRHINVQPASNGFGIIMNVRGNYKGPDNLTVRACGRNNLGRGCITVTYDVTIQ